MPENAFHGLKARYICTSPELPLLEDGAVLWQADRILAVGSARRLADQYPQTDWLAHSGDLVMPGFTNAHEHSRGIGSLRLGVADDMLEIWLPQNTATRSPGLYLSALYNGLLSIASGVTTTMHFHRNSNPATLEAEIEEVLRAYRDIGMRVCIGIPFRNQNTLFYGGNPAFLEALPASLAGQVKAAGLDDPPPNWREIYKIGLQLHKSWQGQAHHWACWAPANLHWCSDDLLIALSEDDSGLPIQMHLVETLPQQKYGFRLYCKTPLARLDEMGFLSDRVSLAHAVHLTDEDIQIVAARGVQVIHNPSSNLRLRSGICRVLDLHRQGVPVGFGLDGQTLNDNQDMLQEIRLGRALAFHPGEVNGSLTTPQVLKMAVEDGANILGGPGPKRGRLQEGWAADFISIDLDKVRAPFTDERIDPLDALVSLGKPDDIELVVIGGIVQMTQGRHTRINQSEVETAIRAELNRTKTVGELEMEALFSQLKPYYQQLFSQW